ncbi:MAG: hypothetical protein K2G39_02785 [Lachnospiraceae bacterium]|nr:hypothetical protein [Lachnospiraceae bacterium]
MKELMILINNALCMALSLLTAAALKAPESFALRDEDNTIREIPLSHCNCRYEEDQLLVYTYDSPDQKCLYLASPEAEKIIYPLTDYLIDQKQDIIWIMEEKEGLQMSRIDLRGNPYFSEKPVIDNEFIRHLLADTYGISAESEETIFTNLKITISKEKEKQQEGVISGMASAVLAETDKRYYIQFSFGCTTHVKGYLQNLSLPSLYQEFLYYNLTAENPFTDRGKSRELSFFDEEIYSAELGECCKRFALYDYNEDGKGELLFQIKSAEYQKDTGESVNKEVIYIFGEQAKNLVCLDIIERLGIQGMDESKKKEKMDYLNQEAVWFDCETFCDIPEKSSGDFLSRDEVFSAIERGDFSYAEMGEKYSYIEKEDLTEENFSFQRCDVNQDGEEELICQVENEIWEDGRINYIFTCRNGKAHCIYFDGSDGNEWLSLGKSGNLYYNLIISAPYHVRAFYPCFLDTAGNKFIDSGLEVITIYDAQGGQMLREKYPEMVEKYPEMIEEGTHYITVQQDQTENSGNTNRKEEMISHYEFQREYQNLTGKIWNGS